MAQNRQAFIKEIVDGIEKICPGSPNTKMYVDMLGAMSDAELDQFCDDLKTKTKRLAIILPNLSNTRATTERNLGIAKDWNHEFREQIFMNPGGDIPPYLTPKKYIVLPLPLTRQAQHVIKKINIPENTKTIDDLTGQPTGPSKGSKISYPEFQILAAMNLDDNLVELIKARGGDIKGFDAMNTAIAKTGGVSLREVERMGGKVVSTSTLHVLLTGMHLENTL